MIYLKNKKALRILVILVSAIVLIVAGFLSYNYFTVFELNKHVDASGVKFLMSKEELGREIGDKGDRTVGFGFSGLIFSEKSLQTDFAYNGLFAGRVTRITTSNPAHIIYGMHAGDLYEDAVRKVKTNGFVEDPLVTNRFKKGFVDVELEKGNQDKSKVEKISIAIDSWSPIPKIY